MKTDFSRSELELLIQCVRSKAFELFRDESDALMRGDEVSFYEVRQALNKLERKLNEAEEQAAIHEFNVSLNKFYYS